MEKLQLGYPLSFIEQNFTKWDPPFPYKFSFGLPQEIPTKILWFKALLSYLIILAILKVTALQIQKFKR